MNNPSFTRKHYQEFARILHRVTAARVSSAGNSQQRTGAEMALADIKHELADVFEKDNPLFNRARFFNAVSTGRDKNERKSA